MATIGLLCGLEEDRRRLTLLAGESGHLVCGAGRVQEAVELMRERRPRLMVVVDSPEQDAAALLREMLRVSPLLPVVVALKERDASRAVELMRTGAAEVVAPPWTRESLEACLDKSLRFPGTAFAVVAAPPKRTAWLYAFCVLAFFALAFGWTARQRSERLALEASRRLEHWDLPYRHPSALAFNGAELWVSDWYTQTLYAHDRESLALRRLVHFPADTPAAFALTPESAWTATASGFIRRHMKDKDLSVVERYPARGQRVFGIAHDGLYLWTLDARTKRLSKRLTDSRLSTVASYRYPGLRPVALAWDGKRLWSLDAGNRELLRHNLERPDEAVLRVPLPEYGDGAYRPVGLSWDGERFWTVGEKLPPDSGPARLFRHAPLEGPRP